MKINNILTLSIIIMSAEEQVLNPYKSHDLGKIDVELGEKMGELFIANYDTNPVKL